MTESRDYLEMTFKSINCFADDGKMDATELGQILDIALKDGVIDDNERRVLTNIMSKIKPEEIDDELREKITDVQKTILER